MPKPLKKHWREGRWQAHIFLRTPEGGSIDYDTADVALPNNDPAIKAAYMAVCIATGSRSRIQKHGFRSKENCLAVVRRAQVSRCGYCDLLRPDKFVHCDCKFIEGPEDLKRHGGEKSGCPELHLVHELLSKMTDEEFHEILRRKIKE